MKKFYCLLVFILCFVLNISVNAADIEYDIYKVDYSKSNVKIFSRTESNKWGVNKHWNINSGNLKNVKSIPLVDASSKVYDFADILTDEEEKQVYKYIEDFVEVAKERNPNLTTNQAKELFFSGDRNDPLRQKVIQSVIRRNNPHHTSAISKPDTSKVDFSESDLRTQYNAKRRATQASIDNAEEHIAEAKENNKITRELISEKVNGIFNTS